MKNTFGKVEQEFLSKKYNKTCRIQTLKNIKCIQAGLKAIKKVCLTPFLHAGDKNKKVGLGQSRHRDISVM